jgi:glycosyl transferase family 87
VAGEARDAGAPVASVPAVAGMAARLTRPIEIGLRRVPAPVLLVLAAVGASLLAIIASTEWTHFNDEHAYWLAGARLVAGEPLYDLAAAPNTPFAYWYPPPLAQVLAPFTSFVGADVFSVAWTVLLLGCLWWLAGRDVLVALALVAFLPVAVELRVRNVHLLLAVLVVLGLRRSWAFWVPAAALKITPVLGVAYLAAAGRWRDAVKVAALGAAVLAVSVALGPGAWREFLDVVGARAGTDGGSLVPIPFAVRFAAGALLVVLAGLLVAGRVRIRAVSAWGPQRVGEALLVVGLMIANPTLWMTAFSLLVAIVPLWRSGQARAAGADLAEAAASRSETSRRAN